MIDIINKLSARENQTIIECLNAAVFGPFFPDWEFLTLFGISREIGKAIVINWPKINSADEEVGNLIVNSMNHLLGYPHGQDQQWKQFITVSTEEVKMTLDKLLEMKSKEKGTGYFNAKKQ